MAVRGATETRSRLEKRIAAYFAAAGAALATAATAEAGVVFTDVDPDVSLSPGEGYSIDFDGDTIVDFGIRSTWNTGSAGVSGSVLGFLFAAVVSPGYTIGTAAKKFGTNNALWLAKTSNYPVLGGWPGQSNKFVGVRFTISGNIHYGWVEMSAASTRDQIVVHSYAYESDPGVAIFTPQVVPEPSSLMLFALGAGGVAAWRARRRKTANKTAKS